MKIEKSDKKILKTVIATMVLLAAFFAQGAVTVMGSIVGTQSALIRGVIIFLTLCYYGIRYKGLSRLGFVKMKKGAAKKLLFFVPMLVIAFSHYAAGFDMAGGIRDLVQYGKIGLKARR